jgi:membrane protein YdbS with pleckstrin-like domain
VSELFGGVKRFLRVPPEPPKLPAERLEDVDRFRPHPGYRRYMAATRWFALSTTAFSLFVTGTILFIISGRGMVVTLIFVSAAVTLAMGIPAHVTAAIRWGTTWYALGRRSIRIRSGLFTITEATVTYDNIQNVKLNQGPLQRLFGISSLEIETAGGSSKAGPASGNSGAQVAMAILQVGAAFIPGGAAFSGVGGFGGKRGAGKSPGTLEGLGDAPAVRAKILERVRGSHGAGLGDDRGQAGSTSRITPAQVAEMRGILAGLRGARPEA